MFIIVFIVRNRPWAIRENNALELGNERARLIGYKLELCREKELTNVWKIEMRLFEGPR